MFSKINGTGSYLPEKKLTNKDLESMVDTTDEWIFERTGIKQRHISSEKETSSFMGFKAAEDAIKSSNISKSDIDLIIVATTTPDHVFPSNACLIQQKLGIQTPAFDIAAACTGYIYALSVADSFIKSGVYENILVIGTEQYSKIIDWDDRTTCVLFGDGAGATIISKSKTKGIISTNIDADGKFSNLLCVPDKYITMKGNEVFKVAVNTMGKLVDDTLNQSGLKKEEINWLVPHQANYRIISATAKKLNMPMENVVVTVDKHGNTSAASIPLALDYAIKKGDIKQNELLLLEAFGSGFTWGSALIRY